MGIADKLSKEVMGWGILGIIIVLMSVIILKFKTGNVGNITCATGYTFNASANNCYLTTNSSTTAAIGGTASLVDIFVTGISEPQNWVIIAIIALIGFTILAYFKKVKN